MRGRSLLGGRKGIETRIDAGEASLRGRSYAIPFERVWSNAILLADEHLRHWSVRSWNDRDGTIEADVRVPILRRTDQVRLQISLDENAQTRVDMASISDGVDLGVHQRRIDKFFRELDRRLGATADVIL